MAEEGTPSCPKMRSGLLLKATISGLVSVSANVLQPDLVETKTKAEIMLEQGTVAVLSLCLPPAANSHKSSASTRARFPAGTVAKVGSGTNSRQVSQSPKCLASVPAEDEEIGAANNLSRMGESTTVECNVDEEPRSCTDKLIQRVTHDSFSSS